ncbi:MAG TPA: DnaJ domain-containing protein [Candidatus Limnocylindria bacterium]
MEGFGDAYRVLQVDPSAEHVVIQAAYRALARRFHPDGDRPDADRMAELNRAYAELRDPERRRRYDVRRTMLRAQPIPVAEAPRRADVWTTRRSSVDPVVLDFGRYAGWRISDLARHDPDYLRWLCRHSSGLRFREAIARVLPSEPDLVRRANSVA